MLFGNKIFCEVGSIHRLINNFYGLPNGLLDYYIKDCSKLIESEFDDDEIDELLSVYLYLGDIYNVIVYRENITLSPFFYFVRLMLSFLMVSFYDCGEIHFSPLTNKQ